MKRIADACAFFFFATSFCQAKAKAAPTSSSGGKAAKKKKWSKGKVKDKAQHAVALDKPLYERIIKEVPTFRFISQSILIERLKINGSLARVAIRHLEKEGQIKRIVHHSGQLIYSACCTVSLLFLGYEIECLLLQHDQAAVAPNKHGIESTSFCALVYAFRMHFMYIGILTSIKHAPTCPLKLRTAS